MSDSRLPTKRSGSLMSRRYWIRYWTWHFVHHPRLAWRGFRKWRNV